MTTLSATESLLALMQMSDSALPVGGYSHSWGLETWAQDGLIGDAESAEQAIGTLLVHSIATQDGVACGVAYRAAIDNNLDSLFSLNQLLSASKWSKETFQASVRMGARLLKLAMETKFVHDVRGLHESKDDLHHCAVFGWLAACIGISEEVAISAFLQNSTASLVSACVRMIPLGHTDGQSILVNIRPLLARLTSEVVGKQMEDISSFAPMHEYASYAHESLYSRLFQS